SIRCGGINCKSKLACCNKDNKCCPEKGWVCDPNGICRPQKVPGKPCESGFQTCGNTCCGHFGECCGKGEKFCCYPAQKCRCIFDQ
ncbi:133_t:CDS:1, partial [Racocetra persica]